MAGYGRFQNVTENCAISAGARMAQWQWQASSKHHRNLLKPTHREVGIARYGYYWTQMFGLRQRNPWDGSKAPRPMHYDW